MEMGKSATKRSEELVCMSLEPQLKKHLFRLSPWMAFCSIDSQLNQEFFSFS